MPGFTDLGRWLVWIGLGLAAVGLLIMLVGRLPGLGRLPGDIRLQRDGVSCFIPLMSSLLISLLLTVLVNVVIRLFRR